MTETVKTYLRPIDREGLLGFAEKGRAEPERRGTNKVHTVMEGQYRSLSYVGDHEAVVVDEPLHLFGQNTAPAPGELELFLEGDIGNTAAWGAGGAERKPEQMGFQEVRVKVVIEGDATREELDDIVQHANFYSPVANTIRNPVKFSIGLA